MAQCGLARHDTGIGEEREEGERSRGGGVGGGRVVGDAVGGRDPPASP